MKIVDNNVPLRSHLKFSLTQKRVVLIVVVITFSLVNLIAGALAYKHDLHKYLLNVAKSNYSIPYHYVMGKFASTAENMTIDIKFKNFKRLEQDRQKALSKGILIADDYVPAIVNFNNQDYKVKIRLKGDGVDHLDSDKWSFRIKVKNDESIQGMKQFSIHHPKVRNYLFEWLYHTVLKQENVISLRYDFINVTLNGKDLGIYAIEEHFEKRLIENNQRKEGPIIRFSEDLFWSMGYGKAVNFDQYYRASEIDGFQTSRYLSDSSLVDQYTKAISVLEAFRRGDLSTSQAFDLNSMAKYLALSDMLGAQHGTAWHNTRYYYNPITDKLEPIGFDSNGGQELISPLINYLGIGNEYYPRLFDDIQLVKKYVEYLELYSRTEYLDTLLPTLNESIQSKLSIIYSEWPAYQFESQILYNNQQTIRSFIDPEKALHANLRQRDSHQIELAFAATTVLPVEIISIDIGDLRRVYPASNLIIRGKPISELIQYSTTTFDLPANFELTDSLLAISKVAYRILGTRQMQESEVFLWSDYNRGMMENEYLRETANINDFEFIRKDPETSRLIISGGYYSVNSNIHIPQGYELFIDSGVTLDLRNESSIISYSPVFLQGSSEKPIQIISTDSSGQGLFVLNAVKPSVLEHVFFRNLSNPSKIGWMLSGAVTFYESDVSINDCQFVSNLRGDDYLNIVRAEFSISNSTFREVIADALDADFSIGSVNDTKFYESGNDAIDISGSNLTLNNLLIDGVGDKGLSAGEMSVMDAFNIRIDSAEIGICSKDLSVFNGTNIFLDDSNIGFTAFQKKSEYGAASIECSNVHMNSVQVPHLIEEQSSYKKDGEIQLSSEKDIKDMLYGVQYGKASD